MDNINLQNAPEIDVFYTCKQTVDRLREVAFINNIEIEEPIKLDKTFRYKNNELSHLEKSIFNVSYQKYDEELNHINLFLAKNAYTEIENVAINISNLVRNKGLRYRDIGVITQNIDVYSNLCKVIFESYNIPLFIDEKKDLSQNILVKFILSILDIFAKNWSHECVFNYLKTGLVDLDKNDMYKLENYCLKHGINRNKWYKKQWNFDEESEYYEKLRIKIVTPLIEFKEKIEKEKTVRNISKILYDFLINYKIDEQINKKIDELNKLNLLETSKNYETSWNTVMNVFDEMVLVMGDELVTFDKYTKLLKLGLSKSEIGGIPASQDQVAVGDIDRTRSHKINSLFIVGLNDGEFPKLSKGEGFFNDMDRDNLKNQGIEMAKGSLDRLFEDNFNMYKAFAIPEDNLFLSYCSANLEGKSLRPSVIISKMKKIFPKIKEESDVINRRSEIVTINNTFNELLNNLRDFKEGKEINSKWFSVYDFFKNNSEWNTKLNESIKAFNYSNKPENLSKENVERLYGKVLKTSVSKLESYKRCPFSYYLNYGLKLEEDEIYKIQPMDTGSFMHDILENFFIKIEDNVDLDDEQIEKILDGIIEEKLKHLKNYKFSSSPKFIVLTNKMKRVVKKSVKYIMDGLKQSDFRPYKNEAKFGVNGDYESIYLDLKDDNKVEIVGKIDRIDKYENEGKKYLRIIDYKSSAKKIDLNDVISGLQLQLLTYMKVLENSGENIVPAGVLYFSLTDKMILSNKKIDKEEVDEAIKNQFKMQGLILEDIDIVKMMDKLILDNKSSTIIPVNILKNGIISENKSSTIKKEKYDALQNQITKILKQISSDILEGKIDINPFYKVKTKQSPCNYCNYKSVCNFNPKEPNNVYNYIKNSSKKEIIDNL